MRVRFACFIMCVLVAIADKIGNMTALSAADPGTQDKQKPCQRGLLAKWKRFLVARDPKVLFADYDKLLVSKLSAYAASCGAKYPVVYLGVTTAQEDPQADQFRTATHWEGLFVDASQEKTESWTKALEQSEATGRALVVHAVVSDMCRHETVPCASPAELVGRFSKQFEHKRHFVATTKAKAPHIANLVKIDIGPTTARALRSLLDSLHSWEMPLLLIAQLSPAAGGGSSPESCTVTAAYLSQKGYEVAPCGDYGQDSTQMVAYLRPKLLK